MKKILWYPKKWKTIIENPNVVFATTNRMRAYNFHENIKDKPEVQSEICGYTMKSANPDDFDIIVFQKFIPSHKMALKLALSGNKLVVMDICDPVDRKSVKRYRYFADLVITSNHELTEDTLKKNIIIPIETVIDNHDSNPEWVKTYEQKDKLRVTWYGVAVNFFSFIKPMRSLLDNDSVEFRWTCKDDPRWNNEWGFERGIEMEMDWRDAWRREDSWQHFIFNSDVGIVPVHEAIKSPHKILNYMAYGIPVICSPTDSHTRIIRHGENGFLASSDEEWKKYLDLLRDPQLRSRIGVEARKTALEEYSIQNISDQYYRILMKYYEQKITSERTLKQKALNFLSTFVPA